jgi:hypothetical protein
VPEHGRGRGAALGLAADPRCRTPNAPSARGQPAARPASASRSIAVSCRNGSRRSAVSASMAASASRQCGAHQTPPGSGSAVPVAGDCACCPPRGCELAPAALNAAASVRSAAACLRVLSTGSKLLPAVHAPTAARVARRPSAAAFFRRSHSRSSVSAGCCRSTTQRDRHKCLRWATVQFPALKST